MLFGRTNPAVRAVIAVALLVIGVVLHRLVLEVVGGVAVVAAGAQWLYTSRLGAGGRRPGPRRIQRDRAGGHDSYGGRDRGGERDRGDTRNRPVNPMRAPSEPGRAPNRPVKPDEPPSGQGRARGRPPNAIEVHHLTRRFGGFTAVDDVTFGVPAGQVTAVLGPNGAGKTTTIEIMEGFLAPTAGGVRVLGADPRQGGRAGRAWRARIGLVLQSTSLDMQLTVAEALRLYAGLYARPLPPGEVLELIDLAGDAGTKIGALSGGQRRRADLGLAVIGRPEVLFLDEPTTGLDPQARRGLWAVIQNLAAAGTTVLLTTHYLDEAQRLADRVIVLDEGRVLADATPDRLRARGGAPVIRFPLPSGAPVDSLPPGLAEHVDAGRGELSVPSADLTADLAALVAWARSNSVDLTGLEVGPPSLEDAYLALTGRSAGTADGHVSPEVLLDD
jgi:ABC-2 type transport system ATP-binding protein